MLRSADTNSMWQRNDKGVKKYRLVAVDTGIIDGQYKLTGLIGHTGWQHRLAPQASSTV